MQNSQNKQKVVIDTNVLLSAAIKPNSTASIVLNKAALECDVFISNDTFTELAEVIHRDKFDVYFSLTEYSRNEFLEKFLILCHVIEITEKISDCKDPKDNKFLEVAIAAKADFLISGDKKHLLSMNPFRGISIISAKEFLSLDL